MQRNGDTRSMGNCTRCDRPLVEVPMAIGESRLTMSSCSRCDQRSWARDGRVVDLTEVLDLTTGTSRKSRPAMAPTTNQLPGEAAGSA